MATHKGDSGYELPSSGPLAQSLSRAQLEAGQLAARGPGLVVTLGEPPAPTPTDQNGRAGSVPIAATHILTDRDVRAVVNQLWSDGAEAIALGLQRSGRIITSAALIIIVVFLGFATGDLMVIKQLGVGLAVAVLIDATLVRCLLVPAFMTWQRRIMWWAPAPLKRLHARFGLSD